LREATGRRQRGKEKFQKHQCNGILEGRRGLSAVKNRNQAVQSHVGATFSMGRGKVVARHGFGGRIMTTPKAEPPPPHGDPTRKKIGKNLGECNKTSSEHGGKASQGYGVSATGFLSKSHWQRKRGGTPSIGKSGLKKNCGIKTPASLGD